MRDILFRGKRKCDGLWVKGTGIIHQTDYYGEKVDRYFIVDGTTTEDNDIGIIYEVIPKTAGQYTGLQDKNGAKIFEGDIVKFLYLNPCSDGFDDTNCGEVIYSEDATFTVEGDYLLGELNDLEVIGNIYDNPELLEVE